MQLWRRIGIGILLGMGCEATAQVDFVAFGDSISQGISMAPPFFIPGGGFARRLWRNLQVREDAEFNFLLDARFGLTSQQVSQRVHAAYASQNLRDVMLVSVNAGGNNFLQLRHLSPQSLCRIDAYTNELKQLVDDWKAMAFTIRRDSPRARILFLGIYYAQLKRDQNFPCQNSLPGRSVAELFLKVLAIANYRIVQLADRSDATYIDLLDFMNCGRPEHDCAYRAGESLPVYQARLIHLLRQGRLRDPTQIDGGVRIGPDAIHPSGYGHEGIAHLSEARLFGSY